MFVITKLVLANNDVQIIGSFFKIKDAKAKLHDLNLENEVSYRDNKMKFFKVYEKGYFGLKPLYIYKILEIPQPIKDDLDEIIDSLEDTD